MEKNNKALIPNAYKTQTPCLHLSLSLLQHHLQLPLPLAYAGFWKGGRKFENIEEQKRNFSTQNQSVFLPKIR